MARTTGSVVLLLALTVQCVSGNMVCLYCSSAVTSTTCERTKTCGPHEICYSDAYVTPDGNLFYELGCRDPLQCSGFKQRDLSIRTEGRSTDSTEVCSECCRGDHLCNSGMCGQTGFLPVGSRGPICFTCDQQLHSKSCNVISQCSRDEVCAFLPAVGTSPSQSRCMPSQECYNKHEGALAIFGRRRSDDGCHVLECCETDLCNNYCNEYTKLEPTAAPITAAPTTAATTTTAATPTKATTTAGSISSPHCPHGWVAFGCSCYLFGHNDVHFVEAEVFCRQNHNSHLVQVQTKEENAFLKHHMTGSGQQYWLGMTDEIIDGVWHWFVDNSRVEFADWGDGEPNNSGTSGEDCAVFWQKFQYKWGDYHCTAQFRPLCELSSNNCHRSSGPIVR